METRSWGTQSLLSGIQGNCESRMVDLGCTTPHMAEECDGQDNGHTTIGPQASRSEQKRKLASLPAPPLSIAWAMILLSKGRGGIDTRMGGPLTRILGKSLEKCFL